MATKIVDSTNKTIGTFISFISADIALVGFKMNGKSYILPISKDSIGENESITIYHTDPDCAGQSYIEYKDTIGLVRPYYNLTSFGWISHHPEGVTPQTITAVSFQQTSGCGNLETPIEVIVITLIEALGPDFADSFIPPFRLAL